MADAGKDVIKAFLGEDTEFNGTLTFAGTVRIDGQFEGKINTSDNLIIGEKSKVKAEISVGTLLVQGSLTGDVTATKRVHIATKGKIIGNVTTPALNIEDGALLQGGVKMLTGAEADALKPGASTAKSSGPGAPGSGQQGSGGDASNKG
ncbi:MAG: polymer-forming cytoskeletal protein [Nitrospinota bacterium]|nr:polymer-forming cytoskeletal protein [Nitrospinota bacterium]